MVNPDDAGRRVTDAHLDNAGILSKRCSASHDSH
jgi:hypothetical protein